jgi:raffinose/stachyose/melibiose transport system permease protein
MKTRQYTHLWFVLPALLVYGLFVIYPTLSAFWLSFYDWNGFGNQMKFVGTTNFQEALTSSVVYRAAWHNLIFFIALFIFQNTVGLFLATQLDERPRLVELYRAVLFLPVIISLVAVGFIWSLMLSPNIGFLNPLLRDWGLGALARPWLSDPTWALPTVITVQAWQSLGWSIVIYLAGLQNIPHELREAAVIDGATNWQRFRRVTFPLLAPAFTSLTVLTFIQVFRTFDVVYVLAGPIGSPAGATDVLGTLIYRTAFGVTTMTTSSSRFSYAIAISVVLFVVLGIASTVLLTQLRRREVQS